MKSARQRARDYADRKMSEYVRARDGECVQCGAREGLTAGHLITRAKYSVRWDERNVFCQCKSCNMKHEYQPEHFTSWWISKYGQKEYERLVRDSNRIRKFKTEKIREIGKYFENKYLQLEDNVLE